MRSAEQFLSRFLAELVTVRYAQQGSLFGDQHWEEKKHPREQSQHGNHRPGQFAPKHTGGFSSPNFESNLPRPTKQSSLFGGDEPAGAQAQPAAPAAPAPIMNAQLRRQEVLQAMLSRSQAAAAPPQQAPQEPPQSEETPDVSEESNSESDGSEEPQEEQKPEYPHVGAPKPQKQWPASMLTPIKPEPEQQDAPQQPAQAKQQWPEGDDRNDPEFKKEFDDLVGVYRKGIVSWLVRNGADYEDAEDAYQNGSLDAWVNYHQFSEMHEQSEDDEGKPKEETTSFRAWLATKVRGKWKDGLRRTKAQKRGEGKVKSLDVPVGENKEGTLADNVAADSGFDQDSVDEASQMLHQLAGDHADTILKYLRKEEGYRTYEEIGRMQGRKRQSVHEHYDPIINRLKTAMRSRNSALYDFIEGEVERYFNEHTLVPPERYVHVKATGNTLFGHLLRGVLTVMAFHLANGAFGAKTPMEKAAQANTTPSYDFTKQPSTGSGSGGNYGGASPPSPQGKSKSRAKLAQEMQDAAGDDNEMRSNWFDGAGIDDLPPLGKGDLQDRRADNFHAGLQKLAGQQSPADSGDIPKFYFEDGAGTGETQALPNAAAMYPKPGDTQNVPSLSQEPASREVGAGEDDTPDDPHAQQDTIGGGGGGDDKHPHVKAGDPQGRGGQFAKKDNKDITRNPAHEARKAAEPPKKIQPRLRPVAGSFSDEEPAQPQQAPEPAQSEQPQQQPQATQPTPEDPEQMNRNMSLEADQGTSAREFAKKTAKARAFDKAKKSGKGALGEWQRQEDQRRLDMNSNGDRVTVNGKDGQIGHAVFGKYRVHFDDGTHALVAPHEIDSHKRRKPSPPAEAKNPPEMKDTPPATSPPASGEVQKADPSPENREQEIQEQKTESPEPAPAALPAIDVMRNPAFEARKKKAEAEAKKKQEEQENEQKYDLSFKPQKLEKDLEKSNRVVGEYEEDPAPRESDFDTPEHKKAMDDWYAQKPRPELFDNAAEHEGAHAEWKKARPDDYEAATKKWRAKQSKKKSKAKEYHKKVAGEQNIERFALHNELDHEDFKKFVEDRADFDGKQWKKDRDFQAALRQHMGFGTHERKKANEGKSGWEEYEDAEGTLAGNIADTELNEQLGVDRHDWDGKAYDIATSETEAKPGPHNEEWLHSVMKDYMRHKEQAASFDPESMNVRDPHINEYGENVPFSTRKRPGMVDRAAWRDEWVKNVIAAIRMAIR